MDILIKNALIITQNSNRDLFRGDINISKDNIVEVAKSINEPVDEIFDATGMIVLPGFCNMHTHVAMTLFRGLGEDLPLHRWLSQKIWPMEAKQTSGDAYVAAKLAFAEMIQSGTTCFNDMCLMGAKDIARAADDIGIRGHVCQGLFDKLPGRDTKSELGAMAENVYSPSSLVSFGVGPHAVYTCSEELLIKAKTFAKKKKLKYHFHASETRKEVFEVLDSKKLYPYEYFDSLGIIDSDSIFAHGSWVTKREISIAGKKNLNVVTCPVSNLKLAIGGICPISEYHAAGANVCIGTDSVASNNSLNMFESMKFSSLLQKHRYWKADILKTQTILDFATINGARALGLNSGSIEPGKLADLSIIRPLANMVPSNDPVSNLVFAAGPQNVDSVMVNGRFLMKAKELLTIDHSELLSDAEAQIKEMKKR